MKVIDMYSGRSTMVELVKETKCYITVDYDGIYERFHKSTMVKDSMLLVK